MPLAPQQTETLVTCMTSFFSDDGSDLEFLLLTKLGIRLYVEVVGRGFPFRDVCVKTVIYLEDHAQTSLFLEAMLPVLNQRADLQKEVNTLLDSAGRSVADRAGVVQEGVREMSANLQTAGVRAILLNALPLLEPLAKQTELVGAYKELHDCLHSLQQQQRRFRVSAARLADNAGTATDFSECIAEMESKETEAEEAIQKLPDNPATVRAQEQDWLARLRDVRLLADAAHTARNAVTARQSAFKMQSLLRQELPRLDRLLAQAAKGLELSGLQGLFGQLSDQAGPNGAGAAATWLQRRAATVALSTLIQASVSEHSVWQSIDQDIWAAGELIPAAVAADSSDFEAVWQDLADRVGRSTRTEPENKWAVDLIALATVMEDSRRIRDWAVFRENFDSSFIRQTHRRFFVLDQNVRKLCGEVEQIGGLLQRDIIKHLTQP